LKGNNVVFVSGSDEHGTPIEVEAIKQNKKPIELTNEMHAKIKDLFEKWEISFDNYTRTESEIHKKFVMEFYKKVYQNGYLFKKKITQLFCENCSRFLPDRFVIGNCPYCGYDKARGDQCENCGRLLEPTILIKPRCAICGNEPVLKESEHFFIDFPRLKEKVENYIQNNPYFDKRIKTISLNYIKDEFQARALTRDNKWGVPAPFEEAKGKTIYVWFEAVLGYISATIEYFKSLDEWKNFWFDRNALTFYFIGKDNIPFHAIIFPALLMANGEGYNLPHVISATEFLTFEKKKFSKSQGIGIWIDEAISILDADYWRYALIYNRPEERDTDFSVSNFVEIVNSQLNDTLGNFIYRVLLFIKRYYNYKVPIPKEINQEAEELLNKRIRLVDEVDEAMKQVKLREALNLSMNLAREGNRFLNEMKPWEHVNENSEIAKNVIYACFNVICTLSVILYPFIPSSSLKIREQLNLRKEFLWEDAKKLINEEHVINEPKIIFNKTTEKEIHQKLKEIRKIGE
jgi:methionyl-tRNA synthetase